MNTNQDYTKKVEKSITDWESVKTTNKLLDTIARHLAVIADYASDKAMTEYAKSHHNDVIDSIKDLR